MTSDKKILLVGATGYLGLHIARLLINYNIEFKAIARDKKKLVNTGVSEDDIIVTQVSDPNMLKGVCESIDVVISCLGITRQQDNVSYMDIDYQANLNILREAEKEEVKTFIYVSAFNCEKYSKVRLLAAKEKFENKLLNSDKLTPIVVRPNGFFSDLEEFYKMAMQGKVYLFGDGSVQINPIHGEDLARFCLDLALNSCDAQSRKRAIYDIGGPEVFSMRDIAEMAFRVQESEIKIVKIPDFIRKIALIAVKLLPESYGGPAEFFLTMLEADSIAPTYGVNQLEDHFKTIK
ncbi:SDR family oxidoreductase [Vibrio sp. 99-70-13A1]|uniref:SDR family oxidoreductase n=1 Tax=Vibrio sp. 99-70-13A1 TaxID=2607601 RepID=UPI001493CA66|nr:SDR family oxidoreductase [Vibrio sp. 99-70-13A1]NOH98981.1 SDR family oxidoreductase [Vibrio sp. 99-70-13A1]